MRIAYAVSLILMAGIPLASQQTKNDAPQSTFRGGTEFVQVPVIVRRSGKHVPGLSKDAFTLQQDGKTQPITSFEEVHATGETQREEDKTTFGNAYTFSAAPPQIVILAFDTVNTPAPDQSYFREELKKYINGMKPEDPPIAFMQLTRGGLRILHDFTKDRDSLLAQIPNNRQPSRNNDRSGLLSTMNNQQQQQDEGLADADPRMDAILASMVDHEDAVTRFQDAAARIDSLYALQQLAQTLKGIPGRKTLIWAGSGFPFMNAISVDSKGQRNMSMDRAGTTLDQQMYTWQLLNDANVAVYPIDTRRIVNTAFETMDPSLKFSPTAKQDEDARERNGQILTTFESIAAQTGGKPCVNRTDLHSCIREAAQDNRDYYLLGFYVDKNNKTPGWHKVALKLNEKASLRYREGFIISATTPEAGRATDLQLALNSSFEFTSLPFTGHFVGFTPAGDKQDVNFELKIPPTAISIDDSKVDFDILAVIRAPGGKEEARISQHIARSLPPEGVATIQAQGISYKNKMAVPPGDYGVWFVLRDNLTGRTGSVTVPLKVQ